MQRSATTATLAIDYSEMCLQAERLRFEKLELEQSNLVLRKYKKIYGHASQIQCSGCNEMFEPVYFKGHMLNCRFLQNLEEATPDSEADLQKMTVKVTQADNEGSMKFMISYCGISWYTAVKIDDLQFVVRELQSTYPNLAAFTQRGNQTDDFLSLESYMLSNAIELVNSFMEQLAKFEVVRNDIGFRILLQINEKLEEDQRRKSKY